MKKKYMKLIEAIAAERKSRNLTQENMAELLGIDTSTYSRIEQGRTELSLDRFMKIVEILGLDVSTLPGFSSQNKTSQKLDEILKILNTIHNKF